MNRTDRRRTYRQLKKVVPTATWAQFSEPMPRPMPRFLYWQGKDYPVKGHVYTHCPELFREWAGQGRRYPKFTTFERAKVACESVCTHCWHRWMNAEALA